MTVSEKIDLRATTLLGSIINAWLGGKRRFWMEGGTWSSKTFSALQFLKLVAERNPEPLLISVVSETMPHLKRGAIRDFLTIMGQDLADANWNKSDFIYRFLHDSKIEFFSADMPSKLRGGRRDILFLNECNNISYEAFYELDSRTRLFTLGDWNPVGEFWWHEKQMAEYPENVYHHSTYKDAIGVIPDSKVAEIEKMEDRDPNWWNVYGLGLIGKVEGLVYPLFKQVEELPRGNYFYGLDFGFSSDPTVLIKNVIVGDNLYSHQVIYETTPMTNNDIAWRMDLLAVSKTDPIFPDPNEPKSAEELRRKGFNIEETVTGAGSVKFGIKKVNSYYQHWTKESLDCIKEQRNHRFIKRREPTTGREYLSDDTTHQWSHGMDARRYAVAKHGMSGGAVDSRPVRYGVSKQRKILGR